ncbi:MAG: ABC transporter ATP-binding protein, partial [Salinispira sp.]
VFRPLIDLLAICSVAFIIYFGASDYLNDIISLGVLIAFINLIQRFYSPVQDMAEKFTLIQSALTGSERVFSLLDVDEREPEAPSDDRDAELPEKHDINGAIEIRNITFSYVPGEPVLRNVSLNCRAGEKIALVGHTGSGKSTIANILTRLWELDSGSILIDGIDITTIPPRHLRSFIQIIQQDVSLFHLTIRDNLLLGKIMDDENIYAILNEVEIGDFVRSLPLGLDTMVAENAANFSVGQLQLFSFARLLIQDPRVVIMDEATASIDTKTEKKVQRAITRILEGRTSIAIAHRLSTIQDADRILVLNKGRIVESGTHNELMKHDGMYRALQETQNRHYII